MSFGLDLPPEIVELFIDGLSIHLGEIDSLRTLLSCALVSRSFSFPARRKLFSSIHLSMNPPILSHPESRFTRSRDSLFQRIGSFSNLIDARGALVLLIRELHINVDRGYFILEQQSGLHKILDALRHRSKNFETLSMSGPFSRPFSWNSIPTGTMESLTETILLPSLRHLAFVDVEGIPISMVINHPCPLSLSLIRSRFALHPRPSESSSLLCLKSLWVDRYMRDFMDRFCRYRRNLHIEHFKAAISDRQDATAVWKFIQGTKDCLTSLDISYSGTNMGSSFRIPIDIGILPDLRCLRLQLQCPKSNTLVASGHLLWLPNSASPPTQIEVLQIIVYSTTNVPDSRTFFCNGEVDDQTTWDILHSDTFRKKHPRLRKIILNFNLEIVPAECDDQDGTFLLSDLSHRLSSDLRVLLAPPDTTSRMDISVSLDVVFESQRLNLVVI